MTSRHNVHSRGNIGQRSDLVTWVGGSCGRHGSYIFYKAFRFHLLPFHGPSTTPIPGLRNRSRERRTGGTKTEDYLGDATERDSHAGTNLERILSLGEFFFVQCRPEDPVCVGEIQLLWHDKHSGQDLSSTRLYYLPETTPAGRTSQHGEDEVLAVSEKIVMRTSDLASWIVEPEEWHYGSALLVTPAQKNGGSSQFAGVPLHRYSVIHPSVNMSDVKLEKLSLRDSNMVCDHQCDASIAGSKAAVEDNSCSAVEASPSTTPSSNNCCPPTQRKAEVVVLNMNAYCRHKAIMKRMDHVDKTWLARPGAKAVLAALGIFTSDNPKARVVFCRDTFDYPQLFEHDLICEELAPVFKGRPRKKLKKVTLAGSKTVPKKSGSAYIKVRNTESPVEFAKLDVDASTPTRRSSSRRRSKRKSPQTILYEDQYAPLLARPNKRGRRPLARTPTPVCELSREKAEAPTSNPVSPASDRGEANEGKGFISAATVAQTANAVTQSPAVDVSAGKRKVKTRRRAGRRSSVSALNIAIQNSLLEHNKPIGNYRNSKNRKSTKLNRSASSSGSSSPTAEVLSNKAPSPAGSSASSVPSNDVYASSPSPSTSPADFRFLASSYESKRAPDNDICLRGLMDGGMPETKSVFLKNLYDFMSNRNTPIGRIPSLGFKKLDLWDFFKLSQEYGGYDMVTAKRLWKHVYDRMGGNPSCTSAATCTRKHFERLLLPFEEHLRQQLRNKEPAHIDASKNVSDSLANGSSSPDNSSDKKTVQRAYNGDAYFYNGAKEQVSQMATETPQTIHNSSLRNGYHDDKSKSPPVRDQTTNITTSSSTIPTKTPLSQSASFVNFETLAHNVIREELMTSRAPARKRSTSPEDLSARRANSSVSENGAVKLSASGKTKTAFPADRFSPPVSYSRASVIVDANRGPPGRPPAPAHSHSVSPRPVPAIATRAYCPRMTAAPPPFIPKRPKPSNYAPQPNRAPVTAMTSLQVMNDTDRRQQLPSISPNNRLQFAEKSSERDRLMQKRVCDDVKMPQFLSTSPSSPKRSRSDALAPRMTSVGSSDRKYDIRSLMSISPENARREFQTREPTSSTRVHQSNPSVLKSEGHSPQPPMHPLPSFVDPRRLAEPPFIVNSEGRSRPTVLTNGAAVSLDVGYPSARNDSDRSARAQSPAKRLDVPRDSQPQTYYRPNGMLATHREAAKHRQHIWQQKNEAPVLVHHRDATRRPDLRLPVSGKSVSPAAPDPSRHPRDSYDKRLTDFATRNRESPFEHRMTPKREFDPGAPQHRQGFSSFSVASLTSNTRGSQPPRVVGSPPGAIPKKPQYSVPSHVKPERQIPVPAANVAPKESYRAPRSSVVDNRLEYHHFQHKKETEKLQQTTLPSIQTPPIPGRDGGQMPASTKAILSTLPLSVAQVINPLIPKNCTPEMLDRILQEAMKTMGLPQSALPNAAMHPQLTGLHEAVLRQQIEASQPSYRAITHQEQQAVAAYQLARAATLTNPIAPQDHAAMSQIYQTQVYQALLRQVQESASTSAVPVSGKLGHVMGAEMLPDLSRLGLPQFPTGPLPGIRNPAYVTVPPHLPSDIAALTFPFARR